MIKIIEIFRIVPDNQYNIFLIKQKYRKYDTKHLEINRKLINITAHTQKKLKEKYYKLREKSHFL